jgi:hypothetical protein
VANISFALSALFGVQDFCSAIEGVDTGNVLSMLLYMWFCFCVFSVLQEWACEPCLFHLSSILLIQGHCSFWASFFITVIYLISFEKSFIIIGILPMSYNYQQLYSLIYSSFNFGYFPDFLNADDEADYHEEAGDDAAGAGDIPVLDNSGWSSRTRFQNILLDIVTWNFSYVCLESVCTKNEMLFFCCCKLFPSLITLAMDN